MLLCSSLTESALINLICMSQVSKMHAHIRYKDGAFYLIDLRSEHGTYITE